MRLKRKIGKEKRSDLIVVPAGGARSKVTPIHKGVPGVTGTSITMKSSNSVHIMMVNF
jgi:hypothetical protein